MTRNLKTIRQVVENSPFSENQVRWWIFNRATNGLEAAGAIKRIGRRIYLDEDALDRWIESQPKTVGGA